MYTTEITEINTPYSAADKTYFIEVKVDVFKAGKVGEKLLHEKRSFGYPLGTTKEFIEADLGKLCKTLASDEEFRLQGAELDAQLADAEAVKKALMKPKVTSK